MSIEEAEEISLPEEEEETINIGLYIGGRNSKGERDGRGWAILPNGDQYDGQYRHGRRHGMGLYVFKAGPRYYGQYRCGRRSGRGLFVYPDGSVYEGMWRKNVKHGKGRYTYSNGDTYCGSWYRGQRHGVGVYTRGLLLASPDCGPLQFKGTWRNGVRVGPFTFTFGIEEKSTSLHGIWDNLFPQGPAVFSFDNYYLLMGYFQSPGRAMQANRKVGVEADDMEENEQEENDREQDVWIDEPSLWYAQDICLYDYSLLPQEPVPLPLSDSEISVCSLVTASSEVGIEKSISYVPEGEGEEFEQEEGICEHEYSLTECESSSQICPVKDPCAIEITNQMKC
ncbi:radial spoke head protein 1 [Glossina fuscipes fuscipes]